MIVYFRVVVHIFKIPQILNYVKEKGPAVRITPTTAGPRGRMGSPLDVPQSLFVICSLDYIIYRSLWEDV
jgi:hypothetical protein